MEGRAYLDTHLMVWLRDGELEKISPRMKALIEKKNLYFSEFVRLELQYLFELGKLREPANEIVMYLAAKIAIQSCDLSLPRIIQEALSLKWTRDPFDRLITANASVLNAPLLTRDQTILENYTYGVG
jgi:PIN domain nuclease of toxin-antitoxin system